MIYKLVIRPLLFLFDPESVHRFVVLLLWLIHLVPGARKILEFCFVYNDKSLERTVFGLKFMNPVGLAAGFDKNAGFYNELSSFGFSFIEIGTVTPLEQPGNPRPRSFRLPKDRALINRMGINNHGVENIAQQLKRKRPNVIIGGNIGKNTITSNANAINDYKYCFEALHEVVDYFVVNVSCPNIGDTKDLQDSEMVFEILNMLENLPVQKADKKPVLLKISPDLNDRQLDGMVEIAIKSGISGFVATNTTVTRKGLKTGAEKIAAIGKGGLSGLPLRDRSTEVIRYLVKKSGGKIPVIGVGGIMDPDDAIEKLEAGASLVQLYTGFIYEGPSIIKRINKLIVHKGIQKK
jgi:dihydroorotate dehydrogenase